MGETMLSVEFARITPSRGRKNRFYGVSIEERTEQNWRVIVDSRWALRPGFLRKCDAEMAKNGLDKSGNDTTEKLLAAGWQEVERIMFESLQW